MADDLSRFHIVSVEDDPSVAKGIVLALEALGYQAFHFPSGEAFLDELDRLTISLMVLDIRLPGMDGFALCRDIRRRGLTFPILMLTARDDESDKITGLEDGADDYMVKPFSLKELQYRIKAMLRRSYGAFSDTAQAWTKEYAFGSCLLNQDHMKLFRENKEVDLTPMEFRLLLFLVKNKNQVFNRKDILNNVWAGDNQYYGDERTVDVHIRHLRKKIEQDPSRPVYLKTLRGEGYTFILP